MASDGTIILAAASVGGGIFSSLALVEYRLAREKLAERHRIKLRWAKKVEVLTDQIERECRDISGMSAGQKENISGERSSHPIYDRIQKLKDAISEAPVDIAKNTEYFMRDTWVKFEMANLDTNNPKWHYITSDTKKQASKANTHIRKYRESLENQTLFEKFRGNTVGDYTNREK